MSAQVLVINSGSSSLKYQVVDARTGLASATGQIERIGLEGTTLTHEAGGDETVGQIEAPDHTSAIKQMQRAFDELGPSLEDTELVAVGHRVVQGGYRFGAPALIDEDAKRTIEELSGLAPLHNPPNLDGIRAAEKVFPDLPH